MPMTVVITRDVEARYRGFLASAMLEVAPGVYVSPDLSASVRDRVWDVVAKWHATLGRGSLTMIWRNRKASGGLSLRTEATHRKKYMTPMESCSSEPCSSSVDH